MKEENIQGCIYKLTNLVNGHAYFGKHKNVLTVETKRWAWHLVTAEKGGKQASYVHRAMKAYEFQFSAEVVWAGPNDRKTLDAKEQYYIKKFHTFVDDPEWVGGYNFTPGGDGVTQHSKAVRKKIARKARERAKLPGASEALSARVAAFFATPEGTDCKLAISAKLKGVSVKARTKKKISDGLRRFYNTAEGRLVAQHLGELTALRFAGPAERLAAGLRRLGCKHTKKARKKIAEKAQDQWDNKDSRAVIVAGIQGFDHSPSEDTRNRIAASLRATYAGHPELIRAMVIRNTGRKAADNTRAKMREAQQRRRQKEVEAKVIGA